MSVARENHEKSRAASNALIKKLEPEIEKFAESFNNPDTNFDDEMTLHHINSSKDRYRIYEIVNRLGLVAQSFMYPNSTNKYIVIKKTKLDEEYDPNKITVDFVNFFVKYTEIPIPTNHPDHFEYFVEKLEKYFGCKKYLDAIYHDISLFDPDGKLQRKNFSLYKKQLWRLKEQIQKLLLNDEQYKEFCKMSTDGLPKIIIENNVYSEMNTGKILLSVDVKSANFRVLQHYCSKLFGSFNEWSDFLQQFTEYKFPLISKAFRLMTINELDNKEANKFPIIFINEVLQQISQTKYNNDSEIISQVCCKNDEVVFEIIKPNEFDYKEFNDIVNQTRKFFRVRMFKLEKISKHSDSKYNYFVKNFIDISEPSTVEFKNIPKRHIMQVVKNYSNDEIEELDFKYSDETGNIFTSDSIY